VETGAQDGGTEQATTPAGWYPDDTGQLRWWDGQQWGQVADQTQQTQQAQTQQMDQSPVLYANNPAPPIQPAQVMQAGSPYLLTIGDIGITSDSVITPNGQGALANSQWIVTDMSTTESKMPAYAIVLAIIFFLACLLGLLFLLIKETKTTGYVEVSVRTGDMYHKTQIPVSNPQQIAQIRQMVSQAQALAAQAH
jgi:hypothetical protein